jgi:hypothetical protein
MGLLAAWEGGIMFENYFPKEESTINFINVLADSQSQGDLKSSRA